MILLPTADYKASLSKVHKPDQQDIPNSARNKQKFDEFASEEWNFKEFNENLKEIKSV